MSGQQASSFHKFQSLLTSQIKQAKQDDEGQKKEEEMDRGSKFNNNKCPEDDDPHPETSAETNDGKYDDDDTDCIMQPLENGKINKDLADLRQSKAKKREYNDFRQCILGPPHTETPEYANSKNPKKTVRYYVPLPMTGTFTEPNSNSASHMKFNATFSTDDKKHAIIEASSPPIGLGCKTGEITVRDFKHSANKRRMDNKSDGTSATTNNLNVTDWTDQTDNCCMSFNYDGELFTVFNENCNENQIVEFEKVWEVNNSVLPSKQNVFCKDTFISDTPRLQNADKDSANFDAFNEVISTRDSLGYGTGGDYGFYYDGDMKKLSSDYHQTCKEDQMDTSVLPVAKGNNGLFITASFSDTADVDKNKRVIKTKAEIADRKFQRNKIFDDINIIPEGNTWQKTISEYNDKKCSRVIVYQDEIQAPEQINMNRFNVEVSPSCAELIANTTNIINDSQYVRYSADCYCGLIQENLSVEAMRYISQRCHRKYKKHFMKKDIYGSAFEPNHNKISRQRKKRHWLTDSDKLSQMVERQSNGVSKEQKQQKVMRQHYVLINDTWHKASYGLIDNLECSCREQETQDLRDEQCSMQGRVKDLNICQNEDFDYECDFHISKLLMPASVSSHMSIQEELRIAEQLADLVQDKDQQMSALNRTQYLCICPKTINSNVCMKKSSSTMVNYETTSLCCHSLRHSSSDTCLYFSVSHSECVESEFAGTNCVENITRKNKEIIGCSDIFQSLEPIAPCKPLQKELSPSPNILLNNECLTERFSVLDSCNSQSDLNTVNLNHHFLGCLLTQNNNSLDAPEKGSDSGCKTNQVVNNMKSQVENQSIKPQHYCLGSCQCQFYIGSPEHNDSNDYLIEYSYSEGKSLTPTQKPCLLPCTVHKNRQCRDWLNKTNSNTLSSKCDCSDANELPYLEASMMTAGSGHPKECKCLDYECLRQRGEILHDHVMRNLHVLKQFAAGGPKKRNFSVKIREAVGEKAKTLIEKQKTVGQKSSSCPPVGRLLIPQTRPRSAQRNDHLNLAETCSKQQALASADSGIGSVPKHTSEQYKLRSTCERNKTPNMHKSSSSKTLTGCLRSTSATKSCTSKSKSTNDVPNVKEQRCLSKDETSFVPKVITKHVCNFRKDISLPSYEHLLETMNHDAALINDSAKCNKISSRDRLNRHQHRNQNANTGSLPIEQRDKRDERLARSERIVNQALDRLCALHQTDQECQRFIDQLKSNRMQASKSSGHNCDLIICPNNTNKRISLSSTSKLDSFGEFSKSFVAPLDKRSAYFFSIEVPQSRPRDSRVTKSRYNLHNQFRSNTASCETRQIIAKTGTNVTRELERRNYSPRSKQSTSYYYSLSKEPEPTKTDFDYLTDNITSHVPYKGNTEEKMSRSDEAIASAAKSECQTGIFLNFDQNAKQTEAKHNKSFQNKSETVQNVKCPSGISISDPVARCSFCRLDKDSTTKCSASLSVSKDNMICTDCAMKFDRKACYVCSCGHSKQCIAQNNGSEDNKILFCESTHSHSPNCFLIKANNETSKTNEMISDATGITEGTQTSPSISSNAVRAVGNNATNSDLTVETRITSTETQYDNSIDSITHKKKHSSPTRLIGNVERHQFASKKPDTKTSLPSFLTSGKRDVVSSAKSVCKKKESESTARPNSPALSILSKASRGFTLPSSTTSQLCGSQDADISASCTPPDNLYRVSLPPSDVEDQTPASVSSTSHSRFSARSSNMDSSTSPSGTIPFFNSKSSSRSTPTKKKSLNDSRHDVHQSISTGINPHWTKIGKSPNRTKTSVSRSVDGSLPKNANYDQTSPQLLTKKVSMSKHRCTSQNTSPYSCRSSLGSPVKESVNSGSSIHSKCSAYSLSSKSKHSLYQQSSSDKLTTQGSKSFSRIKKQGLFTSVKKTSSQIPSYRTCFSSSTKKPPSDERLTLSPTKLRTRSPDLSPFSSRGDNTFVEQQSQSNTPFTEIMPSYDFFGSTPRNRLLFPSHSEKHRQRSHSPGQNRTHSESFVNIISTPFTSSKMKIPSFGEVCIDDSSETFESTASSISNTKELLENSSYNLNSAKNTSSDKNMTLERVSLCENQTVLPQLAAPERSTVGRISSFIRQFFFSSEKINNRNHDGRQQNTRPEMSQSSSKMNITESVQPANNSYLSAASNFLKGLYAPNVYKCKIDQSSNDGTIRIDQEKSETYKLKSDNCPQKSSLLHEFHGNGATRGVTVAGDQCSSAVRRSSHFSQNQKCYSNPSSVTKFHTSPPYASLPSCKEGKTPIKEMCDYSHSSAPPSTLSPANEKEKSHRSLHLSDLEISHIRQSVTSQCSICKKSIKTFRCSCACKHPSSMASTSTSVPSSTCPESQSRKPLWMRLKDIMRQGMGMMCHSMKLFRSLSKAVDPATLPPTAKRTYLVTLLILMTLTGYFCGCYNCIEIILLHSSSDLERFLEGFESGFDLRHVNQPPV